MEQIAEEVLEKIRTFVGPWKELLDIVAGQWAWGPPYIEIDRSAGTYSFATGGWSGHEEMIEALRQNEIAWDTLWESSHRGARYIFRLPAAPAQDSETATTDNVRPAAPVQRLVGNTLP